MNNSDKKKRRRSFHKSSSTGGGGGGGTKPRPHAQNKKEVDAFLDRVATLRGIDDRDLSESDTTVNIDLFDIHI
jgi:hypothetical protein